MPMTGRFAQTDLCDSARLRSLPARGRPLELKHPTLWRESPDRDRKKDTRL